MENVGGAKGSGERPLFSNPIVQEFVPSSAWTHDSNGHYLLVDLPEFRKEQVKLQVDTSGILTFSGERQTNDKRYIIRFQQTSTLPPDSDINRITGNFDSGLLYVTVPKLNIVQQQEAEIQKKENEKTDGIVEEHKQDHQTPKDDENDSGDSSHVGEEERKEKTSRIDDFPEETLRKWQEEPSQLDRAVRLLIQNKQIVFTALLAFALGVWVTRKIGSGGGHVDGVDI